MTLKKKQQILCNSSRTWKKKRVLHIDKRRFWNEANLSFHAMLVYTSYQQQKQFLLLMYDLIILKYLHDSGSTLRHNLEGYILPLNKLLGSQQGQSLRRFWVEETTPAHLTMCCNVLMALHMVGMSCDEVKSGAATSQRYAVKCNVFLVYANWVMTESKLMLSRVWRLVLQIHCRWSQKSI